MSELRKVPIGDRTYVIGQLSAMKQFHVARRLGPLVLSFFAGASEQGDDASLLSLMSPQLIDSLAEMSDEQSEYIINTCLGVVRAINADNSSVPVYDASLKQLRFQDLKMQDMITLVQAVIKDNLGSFFPTGQPESSQG